MIEKNVKGSGRWQDDIACVLGVAGETTRKP